MAQILLVDDDEEVRSAMRRMLEVLGHEVEEAADGQQALQLDEDNPADIFLTDMYMPVKEDVETILELRRRRPEAKVIAMSGGGAGLNPTDSLRVAQLLGADVTLDKPFRIAELKTALEKVLASR